MHEIRTHKRDMESFRAPGNKSQSFVYTANRMEWQPGKRTLETTRESIADVQVRRLRNTQGDQSHL